MFKENCQRHEKILLFHKVFSDEKTIRVITSKQNLDTTDNYDCYGLPCWHLLPYFIFYFQQYT